MNTSENLNIPGGRITTDMLEFQVRTVGEFTRVEEIQGVYVGKVGGRKIFLRDIARVKDTSKEQRSISRINGIPCVSIQVRRTSDANVVKVCDRLTVALPQLQKRIPSGAKLQIIYDESEQIKQTITAMKETAVEGALLAIIVIFVFLGSLRSTIVVSLSIPVSIVATFIMMHFAHITINLITLSAFILAIGRVVDDSIVVLENIFRYIEEGHPPMEAAVLGTKEVGLAVLASTFTTISVFMPLLITGGVVGQIFGPLSKTFMTALLLSMVVAVLLIPMLSARVISMKQDPGDEKTGFWKNLFAHWNRAWKKVETFYRGALAWSLDHRFIVVAIAGGAFLMSCVIFAKVPKSMSPKIDNGQATVSVDSPVGSSLWRTDRIVKEMAGLLKKEVPETENFIEDVGTSPSGQSLVSSAGNEQPQLGGVSIYLVKKHNRKRSIFEVQDNLRPLFRMVPGASFRISSSRTLTGEAALQVLIKGDDLAMLSLLGEKYKALISQVPGAVDIDLNWRSGSPEYRIIVDRLKAGDLELGLSSIGQTLRTYVRGEEVTDIAKFKEKGKQYDISVRLPAGERNTIEEIKNIPIKIDKEINVPLSSVADVILTGAPSKITRQDRARCVIVQGDTAGRPAQFVIDDIRSIMDKETLPPGYTWEVGGEEKRRTEEFTKLWTSLILAVFLVYGILAVQFESFVHPFTIMLAIPLEMVGVSIALLITGEPVSMVIMLALIMLTGIVVSNSILLVNYIIVLREQRLPRREAILKAGPTRLRPIIMTASATMIAMVPLALGIREGSEFFAPLAKVVIGGLTTSTAFTLLVVPVAYTLIDDMGRKLGLAKKEGEISYEIANDEKPEITD